MKLAKVARNVVLARIAWKFIARQRALARQQRRRRMIVPAVIAGAAVGAIWVARRRLGAGTRRALEIGAVEVEVEVERPIGGDARRSTSSARPSMT